MTVNIIKLVVGISDLKELSILQRAYVVDYDGQPAVMVRTRFQPKKAEEILKSEGSLYRVIKGRIQCRQKILGFEDIITADKGRQCAILVDTDIIQTVAQTHRPFQGWRYLKQADTPADRGLYVSGAVQDPVPKDMEDDLKNLGLL